MSALFQRLVGRKIALCITGSVAAVECVKLARVLRRLGADVTGYMSQGAQDIIHPNAVEFATGQAVVLGLTGRVEHLRGFDLVIVAPATANTVSKIVHGISDSPVTALALASKCPVIIAPAMHLEMYENQIFQANLEALKTRFYIVEPLVSEGAAKMAPVDEIVDAAVYCLTEKDFSGKSVVVTAGPTAEAIDPVRVITNRSSGRMGIALAREAWLRGADVTLVYGPGSVPAPSKLRTIDVESASEMADAVATVSDCDFFIGAAAVSDFTTKAADEKIQSRKGGFDLRLTPTPKILANVCANTVKVGFKAEHGLSEAALIQSARRLLVEHQLDLVVANDVSKDIFGSTETEAILVDGSGEKIIGRIGKDEAAKLIFDRLGEL